MDNLKECKTSCYWTYRYEVLGLVLLFIATMLTIISFNSLGIAAMFIVGGFLCCHKYVSCHSAYDECHTECEEEGCSIVSNSEEPIVTPPKRKVTKKTSPPL